MRAFIAFELPQALRSELEALSASLQRALAGVPLSWVPPGNIHLTLKFLGEIQPSQTAALGAALHALASQHTAMDVRLGELGAFPSLQRPHVLWVGLQAPATLHQIAGQLEQAMQSLGFVPETRPFTPHLTLARTRREAAPGQLAGVQAALAAQAVPVLSISLGELVLFESQLKAGGAVYNPLVRISLRTAKG